MNRAVVWLSTVLGAGFSALSLILTNLTVYDGSGSIIAFLPMLVALMIAGIEAHRGDDRDDLPDEGLTDEEIRKLGGEPDA